MVPFFSQVLDINTDDNFQNTTRCNYNHLWAILYIPYFYIFETDPLIRQDYTFRMLLRPPVRLWSQRTDPLELSAVPPSVPIVILAIIAIFWAQNKLL